VSAKDTDIWTCTIGQIITNVRAYLAAAPDADYISVSQNDNLDYCKSPEELAVIAAEGSPMAPLLRP
jgi:hypothetical protein